MQTYRILYRFLAIFALFHVLISAIFILSVTQSIRHSQYRSIRSGLETKARLLCEHVEDVGEVDRTRFREFFSRIRGSLSYRFVIVSSDGKLIADSNEPEAESTFLAGSATLAQAEANGIAFEQREEPRLRQPMLSCVMKYSIGDDEATKGLVCVSTMVGETESLIRQVWWWSVGFASAIGAAFCLLMTLFRSTLLRPLHVFSESARRIGAGAFDRVLPFRNRNDEWGELGEAFRQMQTKLSTRESKLHEGNERMKAVLGSMIEGVLSTDADGIVLTANEAACEMLSVSSVELLDRNLLDVIRYPELRRVIESTKSESRFADSEFETTDRSRRLLKAHVARLSNDTGEIAIVLHDVTDLRALETMRRDFVANVSHELKTPLSAIKAYAETLKMGAINDHEKNLQFVEQIESQAEMLNLQIQDLIELARIESGKAASEISPVPINEVCRKCLERLTSHANKRQVELQFDPDESLPMALAEHNGLTTIVTNLLTNAIHYTPAEGSVTVRTTCNGDVVAIDVIDTGIGIAPDEQFRVFERFYRVDKARSRDMGGTGLGLSIVKHLTQSYQGKVKLKSQIGKGSTFRIELPSA